ncbi:hypothetical protein E2562_023066 [Oryza meyeriana var. granulata]|uniref:Uncharacterized protein n=1 Tax=Oryza meyeriana var. granulata TaxID=110450 RepID=A0A6G1ENY5_9ORYZ|nr:hypothetical protein E2562_023066 [Oryza meyeriana var. granulata]
MDPPLPSLPGYGSSSGGAQGCSIRRSSPALDPCARALSDVRSTSPARPPPPSDPPAPPCFRHHRGQVELRHNACLAGGSDFSTIWRPTPKIDMAVRPNQPRASCSDLT